ncbi:MAG: roadblock/LC7 domain-containing protein [Planctomycetes bacterium]|nr:roadblock/LC7 domain-containing protein [Planctomycetota bacterium]
MTTDHGLRESRLVFYSDNMEQIDRVLGEFLRRAGARSAYLIDRDGHLITHVGEAGNVDPDTISALVAGSFAATKAMAKLLGEQEFSALFHQGERDNIQLSLVGGRAILTVLFDDSTTLGMVRLYTSDAVRKLGELFAKPKVGATAPSSLDPTYGSNADRALDDLFKDSKS